MGNSIENDGLYAFWDLIKEEAHKPRSAVLREGSFRRFQEDAKDKNVYLFGCNDACRAFIQAYGDRYHIAGIFDNDRAKWNTFFEGFRVFEPVKTIPGLSEQENVVVVTMRLNADEVADQLETLGFCHYYGLGVLVAGLYPYSFYAELPGFLEKNIPVQDIVLIESTNDFDGNSGALYEYLKAKGSRHKFVWVVKCEEHKKLLPDETDVALCPRTNIRDLQRYIYYRAVSRWQIWDNFPLRKVRPDQVNVFLQHYGMGYKQLAHIFNAPEYVDYALCTCGNFYKMAKDSLRYAPTTRILYGQLPRNDVLFSGEWTELEKITSHVYDKAVIWAPTMRKSRHRNRVDSDLEYPYGISVIYTEEEMKRLNGFLRERNMLMVIKIHPSQRPPCRMDKAYSNILYLDWRTVKKVHAYKLLTQMDAMISDYSSIVFDYMLLDRPIAWALEDREHYRVDWLMDNPMDFMPGEKIYDFHDLLLFLEHVRKGEDPFRQERRALSEKYNAPAEGRGCENIAKVLGL